ncbi:MAG: PSD1 and planctomycete cytochrome C domain-containing protein [Maioricimonas sp. JB049]
MSCRVPMQTAIILLVFCSVTAAESSDVGIEAERLFAADVLPLLKAKCLVCHGDDADDLKGALDMRSRAGLLRGGDSEEPAVIPGDPDGSLLYQAIRWDGLEMPPKENDRLTPEQISRVHTWIAGGAPWPAAERIRELQEAAWETAGGVTVATSGGLSESWTNRRYDPTDLWAYQPVQRPKVPAEFGNGSANPIDAFINRKLAEQNLSPLPEADRRTLIRRATFDLTGLPPTPEEVDRFLAEQSPRAWEQLIDRLLASPRYGEQWARHWLDVVRYADTAGFSNDFARPNAWRYRDYVIRAFNSDKPFDRFVREQVAGDEIAPDDPEALVATGYLRMGPWEHTAMSVAAVTRQQYLDDVTNSVGVTFLAHELRCAKCHDHKFDPIPTRDYYRITAAFAPVQFADRDVPYLPVENTSGFHAGRERLARLEQMEGVRSLTTIPREHWPVDEYDAETEEKGHNKVRRKREQYLQREGKRYQPLALSVYSGPDRAFRSNTPVVKMPPPQKRKGKAADIYILTGGAIESPGELVTPGVLSAITGADGSADLPRTTIGRRAALADWIASPDNPLTARVMLNRIWQWHFGTAIAGNPNNFGKTGKKPTHPELLDFLASEFVARGWSIKEMHRLIMTSAAYRRASGPVPAVLREADPNGQLLAWFEPRRLTAEELRDTMLAVSGELNPEMGGVPVRPEINMEVAMQPRHIMGSVGPAYQPSRTPEQRNRRTIYAERIRTLRDPMLEVFNQPGLDTSCERRDASTITPQVFTLLNSQSSHDRAVAMALRLADEVSAPHERVKRAFRLVFGRAATDKEIADCLEHVRLQTAHHRAHQLEPVEPPTFVIREMVEEMTGLNFYWVEDLDVYQNYVPHTKPWDVSPEMRAWTDLCLVLLNSNEFIYVY